MPVRISRRALLASPAALALAAEPLLVKAKRKPQDDWSVYPTRTVEQLPEFRPAEVARCARYGGRTDRTAAATGFFRPIEEKGRWWLVDPDGHLCLNVGVVSVSPGRSKNNAAALEEKYGSEARWAEGATSLLREYDFHAVGNWSAIEPLRAVAHPLPYTVNTNFMGGFGRKLGVAFQQPGHLGYPGDCMPVFHPEFERWCDEYARTAIAAKDDPFLVGYFSDNELPAPADLLDRHLKLDPGNPHQKPGYDAAKQWMAGRPGGVEDNREAFREHVYERYLALTARATRKQDPNHLCLGPRFHGSALRSPGIFRAAGRHLDVIAVNIYGQWAPAPEMLAMWRAEAGKPFVVTEFYAKGDDVGFPNTTGAGWLVPTQADRARFYQNFVLGCLESKLCVGWHWFKYMDNDPEDLTTDPSNRDSNKGIVTIRYEPYRAALDGMLPLNRNVYALADYFDRNS